MSVRVVRLYPRHEFTVPRADGVRDLRANIANLRSPIVAWRPPVNTWFGITGLFVPVIKLFTSAGAQISGASRLFFGKLRPGDSSPEFAPGGIDLFPFIDLTTAQQRDADNAATLMCDIGADIWLREEEQIVVHLESPEVIDPARVGTTFELPVEYGQGALPVAPEADWVGDEGYYG